MKLRSGLVGDEYVPPSRQEMITCIIAVNGRQVIAKALLFMYHNMTDGVKDLLLAFRMSMTYAFLSPNGISHHLKKYLTLVMQQGYLSPDDCEESVFAKRALDLYPQVHGVFLEKGTNGLSEFLSLYVGKAWQDSSVTAEELLVSGDLNEDEAKVVANEEEEEDGEIEESDEEEEYDEEEGEEEMGDNDLCDCEFCEEMRSMLEVDMDSIRLTDPFEQKQWDLLKATLSQLEFRE